MTLLHKGQHGILAVTPKARMRIMAGLSWDAADKAGFMERMQNRRHGRASHHDLDLACYIYGPDGNYITRVTPLGGETIDESGQVYHTGDNAQGAGEGDDEQISAELKDLRPDYHHLVFAAILQGGQTLDKVKTPEIRLADGFTNENFLRIPLTHAEGRGKTACVFAHVYRGGGTGRKEDWHLHHVCEYLHRDDFGEWETELARFLETKEVEKKSGAFGL